MVATAAWADLGPSLSARPSSATRRQPPNTLSTSKTKLIPKILKRGLVIGEAKVDPDETPGVYLSARHSSGSGFAHALGYARRAAGRLGGEPVVLTVRVPFDSLSWDSDDEDIASGNYQFVTDEVPLSSIIAVDDEPVKRR